MIGDVVLWPSALLKGYGMLPPRLCPCGSFWPDNAGFGSVSVYCTMLIT